MVFLETHKIHNSAFTIYTEHHTQHTHTIFKHWPTVRRPAHSLLIHWFTIRYHLQPPWSEPDCLISNINQFNHLLLKLIPNEPSSRLRPDINHLLSSADIITPLKTYSMVTHQQTGNLKPKTPWSSKSHNAVCSSNITTCYTQAIKESKLREAMTH